VREIAEQMSDSREGGLLAGYREMAADRERESSAHEWCEGLIGGAAPEPTDLRYDNRGVMKDSELLKYITKTIVERFHPRRIILFGSHARGEARAGSDVDIFVEMESEAPPPRRAVAISSVFGLRPWSMDLVVYTPQEVEKLRGVGGTLLSLIEAEGKPLYELR